MWPGRFEPMRRLFDSAQLSLIPAHVTLCRESELNAVSSEALASLLGSPAAKPITLRFGRPEPSSENGVLLPCVAGTGEFHPLRHWVLGTNGCKHQEPHITLSHPRNPRAPGNNPSNSAALPIGLTITFTSVCLVIPWCGSCQTLNRIQCLAELMISV